RRQHGFSSSGHPASAQSPVQTPPFSACGRTMGFRSGRVDHLDVVGTEFDQGGEQPSPMPLDAPTPKAIVNRGRRAISGWRVLPTTSRFQNMNDAADDATIVVARRTGLIFRQQWLDRRPLPIIQPKFSSHDSRSVSKLESHFTILNQSAD